jgi:hypothetical protein
MTLFGATEQAAEKVESRSFVGMTKLKNYANAKFHLAANEQQVLRLRRRSAACAQDDKKAVVSGRLSVVSKSRSLAALVMTNRVGKLRSGNLGVLRLRSLRSPRSG